MKNTYFLKENKQNSMQIWYANESISQHLTNPNKSDIAQTIVQNIFNLIGTWR